MVKVENITRGSGVWDNLAKWLNAIRTLNSFEEFVAYVNVSFKGKRGGDPRFFWRISFERRNLANFPPMN